MKKAPQNTKELLDTLQAEIKRRQSSVAKPTKAPSVDEYIQVKVKKNQAHFKKIAQKDKKDKATGNFYMIVDISARKQTVFVPVSIASGKKVTGFMYQIEGTAEGKIVTANVKVRGEGVSQVTVGTLLFAKIPAGSTASFTVQATIQGSFGKTYKLIFPRLNYKLNLSDARYQQYLYEIKSDQVKFS